MWPANLKYYRLSGKAPMVNILKPLRTWLCTKRRKTNSVIQSIYLEAVLCCAYIELYVWNLLLKNFSKSSIINFVAPPVFIALFLEELFQLKSDDKLSGVCQKTYSATLGQYHPWIIQKAAIMAMYALPTKFGLLQRVIIKAVLESVKYLFYPIRLRAPMKLKNTMLNYFLKLWMLWKRFTIKPKNCTRTTTYLSCLKVFRCFAYHNQAITQHLCTNGKFFTY